MHMGKLRHRHTSLHPKTTLLVWTLTPMGRFSKIKNQLCKLALAKKLKGSWAHLANVAQMLEMLISHCTIYY